MLKAGTSQPPLPTETLPSTPSVPSSPSPPTVQRYNSVLSLQSGSTVAAGGAAAVVGAPTTRTTTTAMAPVATSAPPPLHHFQQLPVFSDRGSPQLPLPTNHHHLQPHPPPPPPPPQAVTSPSGQSLAGSNSDGGARWGDEFVRSVVSTPDSTDPRRLVTVLPLGGSSSREFRYATNVATALLGAGAAVPPPAGGGHYYGPRFPPFPQLLEEDVKSTASSEEPVKSPPVWRRGQLELILVPSDSQSDFPPPPSSTTTATVGALNSPQSAKGPPPTRSDGVLRRRSVTSGPPTNVVTSAQGTFASPRRPNMEEESFVDEDDNISPTAAALFLNVDGDAWGKGTTATTTTTTTTTNTTSGELTAHPSSSYRTSRSPRPLSSTLPRPAFQHLQLPDLQSMKAKHRSNLMEARKKQRTTNTAERSYASSSNTTTATMTMTMTGASRWGGEGTEYDTEEDGQQQQQQQGVVLPPRQPQPHHHHHDGGDSEDGIPLSIPSGGGAYFVEVEQRPSMHSGLTATRPPTCSSTNDGDSENEKSVPKETGDAAQPAAVDPQNDGVPSASSVGVSSSSPPPAMVQFPAAPNADAAAVIAVKQILTPTTLASKVVGEQGELTASTTTVAGTHNKLAVSPLGSHREDHGIGEGSLPFETISFDPITSTLTHSAEPNPMDASSSAAAAPAATAATVPVVVVVSGGEKESGPSPSAPTHTTSATVTAANTTTFDTSTTSSTVLEDVKVSLAQFCSFLPQLLEPPHYRSSGGAVVSDDIEGGAAGVAAAARMPPSARSVTATNFAASASASNSHATSNYPHHPHQQQPTSNNSHLLLLQHQLQQHQQQQQQRQPYYRRERSNSSVPVQTMATSSISGGGDRFFSRSLSSHLQQSNHSTNNVIPLQSMNSLPFAPAPPPPPPPVEVQEKGKLDRRPSLTSKANEEDDDGNIGITTSSPPFVVAREGGAHHHTRPSTTFSMLNNSSHQNHNNNSSRSYPHHSSNHSFSTSVRSIEEPSTANEVVEKAGGKEAYAKLISSLYE